MIPKNTSSKVLSIGPDFINHRGGIGEVIQSYASKFEQFHFIPTYKYHTKNTTKSFYFLQQLVKFILHLVRNRQIKIVHIHFSDYGSFFRKSVILLISRAAGKKVIFHCHAAELHLFYRKSRLVKSYIHFILKHSNRVICVSPQWKTFFKTILPSKRVDVVNNPVSPSSFDKTKKDKNITQFLFLGRIGNRKGIYDLLTAISLLPASVRGSMRLYVGGDGDAPFLNNMIKQLKLESIVFHKGWVTGADKYDLLTTSDVYVLPSYNEGLPVSILEAMSFGMPIISTPVGGIPEIVKEGRNGFMVKPGDCESLSKCLSHFIEDKELSFTLGQHSLELVKPYLISEVIRDLTNIYIDELGELRLNNSEN